MTEVGGPEKPVTEVKPVKRGRPSNQSRFTTEEQLAAEAAAEALYAAAQSMRKWFAARVPGSDPLKDTLERGQVVFAIKRARAAHLTWADIGDCMEITGQSAWDFFKRWNTAESE